MMSYLFFLECFLLTRSAQWFSLLKRMVNCTFLFSSTDSDRKWNICRSSNELCFTHHSISGCDSGKQSFSLLCMRCCFEMPFPMLPEGNRWTQMYLCYFVFQQSGIPDYWKEENWNMKVYQFFPGVLKTITITQSSGSKSILDSDKDPNYTRPKLEPGQDTNPEKTFKVWIQ